ncbi:MAG: hypothetical protein IPM48_09110 [Saprospiraceae bacterium]|nr:hypothetical protein [Saprospiraceae bacterium]
MKRILENPTRVKNTKQPPITPDGIFTPLADLSPGEWLDIIDQTNIDIHGNVKDEIELMLRTVRLSLNHGIEHTTQGPMYLNLIPPYQGDFYNNTVTFESENVGSFPIGPLVTIGGTLWLILPIGKKYAVDFSVQTKKKNTYFHIGVRYKDFSDEFTIASKDNGQHLTFTVDTTKVFSTGLILSICTVIEKDY